MKLNKLILAVLMVFLLMFSACKTNSPTGEVTKEIKDSVDVVFYVMSQCPFGLQVENGFNPVLEKFSEVIDFRLEFIGASKEGKFQSLHGEPEINGNKVQLCAQKHEPNKFMNMVVCMNKDSKNIPDNWEECVEGLDKEKIKSCYEGDEGNKLLEDSFAKAQGAKARGSPTMFFNDEIYNGDRDEDSFTRAVCRNLNNYEGCEGIPVCVEDKECPVSEGKIPVCENPDSASAKCSEKDDAKVIATVLTSKDCSDCDISPLIVQLKTVMLNLEEKVIDISSEEGKNWIEKYNIEKVPVIFFSKSLKDTFLWKAQGDNLKASFDEFDDIMMIKAGQTNAHFLVDEEKRKEKFESLGIKLGDNKPQIDFFIMSYCPYGNQAEEGIAPVYDLLKEKVDFNPHYVIYSNYGGGGKDFCFDDEAKYCSMHGVQELNQGIRELCVAKHLGTAEFFKFVIKMNTKCTYKNADSCWEAVAKDLGLDTDKINDCFKNEAEEILEEELRLNKAYGAKGSPQVFIDGKAYNSGRDPNSYKEELCKAFNTIPEECSTKLNSESAGNTGSC